MSTREILYIKTKQYSPFDIDILHKQYAAFLQDLNNKTLKTYFSYDKKNTIDGKTNTFKKCHALHQQILKKEEIQQKILIASNITILIVLFFVIRFYKITLSKKRIIRVQNKSLNNLNRLKDELLSVLAHDLRSPTHHLIMITDHMKTELKENNLEKLNELIRIGNLAANKSYLLLDNLLHWIMLRNKNMFFQKEKITLVSLLEQIIPVFIPAIEMKEINFVFNVSNESIVYGDINSLKVVFRNLIDNAIKFTPNQGDISIKIIDDTTHSIVAITDSGAGIDEKILHKLHNIMIETTTDTNGKKSTGLGLRLCSSFVKRNQGTLTIQSTKNVGTTVFVKLPKSKCIDNEKN